MKKSEAIEKLTEIVSTTRQIEKQEKVWDYLLFFTSAFVISAGLYAAFVVESYFLASGWAMSLYWILSTVKFRKERDAFRNLWVGALEEIIKADGNNSNGKENK